MKKITDLEPLAELSRLAGLEFSGPTFGANSIDTFAPLSGLTGLRWLHLGGIKPKADGLKPLAALKALRWLGVGKYFSLQEFAWLSRKLPNTDCPWFRPYEDLTRLGIKCKKCRAPLMGLTGKGKGNVCPRCEPERLASHIAAWEAARESAR